MRSRAAQASGADSVSSKNISKHKHEEAGEMMYVASRWIPKSERGRAVARVLREAGFAVRDQDVCGHFASNLSCWPEVNAETRQRIAYALDPEAAMSCERDAEEIIARMTDAERDLYEKDLLDWAR